MALLISLASSPSPLALYSVYCQNRASSNTWTVCSFSLTRKILLTLHKTSNITSQKFLPSLYIAIHLPLPGYSECLETYMMIFSSLVLVQCLLCLVSKKYISEITINIVALCCYFNIQFSLNILNIFFQGTGHIYTTGKKWLRIW